MSKTKSLSDYKDIYRNIASNLNLQGESVDLLVSLLANASYIEEVENITYARESQLSTAMFINSKIVHCINQMYSVYRGTCPRVLMRFKADRIQDFNLFDEISVSNNFKVYYLGYYDEMKVSDKGTESVSVEEGFIYSPLSINLDNVASEKTFTIIGLLAKEVVDMEWTINASNPYYVNCNTYSGLSNDMYVKIEGESGYAPVTRHFSDHVEYGRIFDLTLPDYGSRLYFAGALKESASTKLSARYFKYSTISEYNESELKKMKLKGAELISFSEDPEWLKNRNYDINSEISTGLLLLEGKNKDTVISTHYKANKERYLGSVIRSNSDLGALLEELYPEKVKSTYYEFNKIDSIYTIYYIPKGDSTLTFGEKNAFIENRRGYFVTNSIKISEGKSFEAQFSIKVKLRDSSTTVKEEIDNILNDYSKEFNVNLLECLNRIRTDISKIPNVLEVESISITYQQNGEVVPEGEANKELFKTYFTIRSIISTSEN